MYESDVHGEERTKVVTSVIGPDIPDPHDDLLFPERFPLGGGGTGRSGRGRGRRAVRSKG